MVAISTDTTAALAGVSPPPRPHARTRSTSKRALLLAAARMEFATNGFLGTQLAVVASRVGIRKSTVFHYYPDKHSLYVAAVDEPLLRLADHIDACVDAGAAWEECIDQIVSALHRSLAADATLSMLLLRSFVDAPPTKVSTPTAMERIERQLIAAVQKGITAGSLPRVNNARAVAACIIAVVCLGEANRQAGNDGMLIGVTEMKLSETKARVYRVLGMS